jgi:predicted dehydrogenase
MNVERAVVGCARQRTRRPRVGFLGVGWIGRARMRALVESDMVEVAGIADAQEPAVRAATEVAPEATVVPDIETLLRLDLDGIVIATPSALHASQVIRALNSGVSVFCQKPLGRNAQEAVQAVEAARAASRLLAVDLSYRFTAGMQRIKQEIAGGALGEIYAVDLVFHNAYGPDKPWFYDIEQSGGGCVIDLGTHLVDLALWTLSFPSIASASSALFAKGKRLQRGEQQVEDFAVATLALECGATVRLACSWGLPAGCDAVISASFFGTKAGAAMSNVGGSFYDFSTELLQGTRRVALAAPPDAWGGRAALDWAERLALGGDFDPRSVELVAVARAVDRIYGRA